MMNEPIENPDGEMSVRRPPTRHWLLFVAGVLLFVLGPALYMLQIRQRVLWMPWYVPILATIGVGMMLLSVWRRPGWIRIAGLLVFGSLCAAHWFITLVAVQTPQYEGPATTGNAIPAFTTRLANGEPFTQADLKDGADSLLMFFRGRW